MFSNRKNIGLGVFSIMTILFLLLFLRKTEEKKSVFRDFDDIKKSDRLIIATDESLLGIKTIENKISGFNYQIAKAFADSSGLELEVVSINNLDLCIKGILNNKYDIIAICIPTTNEMKKKLAFSIPIYNSRQVLVQLSDSAKNENAYSLHFLANDSICIPTNSPHKLRLQNLSNEIATTIKIVEVKSKNTEDLVKMVSEGKIKYTLCDEIQAKKLKTLYPNINIETAVGFTQPLAWALNPNSKQLLEKLNNFLNYFLSSSDYWTMYKKYL